MRSKVINKIMKYIKENKALTIEEEEKIIYGLESIYILVTKLIIIFSIAYILDIFKEMLIFLIIFNIIRSVAFGLHASKSWICLISSICLFIGLPILNKIIVIPYILKFIIGIISLIIIYKYSPADTYNRPIVSIKRRKFYNISSTIITIIYILISLCTNKFISNCLIVSLLLESILISPITYKLFKLPYNNYLNYIKMLERNDENVTC